MSERPQTGATGDELAVSVVVFAKAPDAGRVKTRLAAELGDEVAVGLYRCFVADLAQMVARLADSLGAPVHPVLAYAGGADHEGFEPFRKGGFEFVAQGQGTLGERLSRVSRRCFDDGADQIVIIGTDSPTLGPRHVRGALAGLEDADVVVGPSFDGGYYLIGLGGAHVAVFDGIDWSTARVFGQTMRRCREASLLCEALEFWYDVDTFEDLQLLKTHLFDYLRNREPGIANRTAEFLSKLGGRGLL